MTRELVSFWSNRRVLLFVFVVSTLTAAFYLGCMVLGLAGWYTLNSVVTHSLKAPGFNP
jgi:hypothetical protein